MGRDPDEHRFAPMNTEDAPCSPAVSIVNHGLRSTGDAESGMVPAGWKRRDSARSKKTRRGAGQRMLHEMIDRARRARAGTAVLVATALAAALAAAPMA